MGGDGAAFIQANPNLKTVQSVSSHGHCGHARPSNAAPSTRQGTSKPDFDANRNVSPAPKISAPRKSRTPANSSAIVVPEINPTTAAVTPARN